MKIRDAEFALRIVRRREGNSAIVYRRALEKGTTRLTRVAAMSPLAYSAAVPFLRTAVRAVNGPEAKLSKGPYLPLDPDWGARVAIYAFVSAGLRETEGLTKAVQAIQNSDGAEAAWWLGLMTRTSGHRAVRALRILVEAVK